MTIIAVECLSPPLPRVTDASYRWWSAVEYRVTLDDGSSVIVPHAADSSAGFVSEGLMGLRMLLERWIFAGGQPTENGVPRQRPAKPVDPLAGIA